MANSIPQKKGLTTFGWLALGGAAAAFLSNKDRREKLFNSARGLAGKVTPAAAGGTQAETTGSAV